jgi:hypothetical protein
MAKPPSIPEAPYCPLIQRGCIENQCAWWIGIWGRTGDGEPVLDEQCALVWQVQLQSETLIETARVTAGHDKAANQVNLLGQIIAEQARNPSLPIRP